MSKEIYYKIYKEDGTYVDTFFDFEAGRYTASINSGYAGLDLDIPRPFDYVWSNIEFNGYVERYVADSDAPSGVLTYKGFISDRETRVGSEESSSIQTQGYWAKLSKEPIVTGSSLTYSFTSKNTGEIIRTLIDQYRVLNPNTQIEAVTTTEVPNTTVTITHSFTGQTFGEAIIEAKNMTGADYYVFLDNDNKLYLKQIDTTTVDHYFVMGRDIRQAKYSENTDKLVNGVYFWNAQPSGSGSRVMKLYTATDSINTYGRQFMLKKDGRFTQTASINAWADRYLNAYKDPQVTLDIEIMDKEFAGEGGSQIDIESIKPGQTFKILNIDPSAPFANTVYYITKTKDNEGQVLTVSSVDASQYTDQLFADLATKGRTEAWGVTYTQPFTT